MGKKKNWFAAVKRVIISSPKDQKQQKSKKSWSEEPIMMPSPPPPQPREDVMLTEAEIERRENDISAVLASARAEAARIAAAEAARIAASAEAKRAVTAARFPGKSEEEIAAIRIQTLYRGYLARRAFRALRGLVRLKTLVRAQSVVRQANTTLQCMQTLARVQSQIRSRRIRLSEENRALQRQLQHRREKEFDKCKPVAKVGKGNGWDHSAISKEQVEAKLQSRKEAARRRERALAYSFSHQQTWKNKSMNQTFMDPNNPHWGWSWLERWMAARPWENRSTVDYNDIGSVKSVASRAMSAMPNLNTKKVKLPNSHQPPSTKKNSNPSSPNGSQCSIEDDLRNLFRSRSEHCRRHSIASSSLRDDASLASAAPVRTSKLSSSRSANSRTRFVSPGVTAKKGTSQEKQSSLGAKKRLSLGGPARRHSGPAMMVMKS